MHYDDSAFILVGAAGLVMASFGGWEVKQGPPGRIQPVSQKPAKVDQGLIKQLPPTSAPDDDDDGDSWLVQTIDKFRKVPCCGPPIADSIEKAMNES